MDSLTSLVEGYVVAGAHQVESSGTSSYFDRLAKLVEIWRDLHCRTDDGRPRMQALRAGLQGALAAGDWSLNLAIVKTLAGQMPRSPIGPIFEAAYWESYAWDGRGHGDFGTTTPDGARLFEERLLHAEKVLLDTKPAASVLPTWYELSLSIEAELGRPRALREAILNEAVARFPDYWAFYSIQVNFAQPKWGGSWEEVDRIVDDAAKKNAAVEGQSFYARGYWRVYQLTGDDISLFKRTHAKWPRMKKGFEDMLIRYPGSNANLNMFAVSACIAEDGPTFTRLRAQIGDNVIGKLWTMSKGSFGECARKYAIK